MVRTCLTIFAVLAIGGLAAAPTHAGAPGAKGGSKTPIKFKNIGQQPVRVSAFAGPSRKLGSSILAQNGTYTVNAASASYLAVATGINSKKSGDISGSVGKQPIYLYVESDNTATTITVAPKF